MRSVACRHCDRSWLLGAHGALAVLIAAAGIACGAEAQRAAASERWPYFGLRSAQIDRSPTEEMLPDQTTTTPGASDPCTPLLDTPQALLTVEIQPVDQPGQIDLDPESRPIECVAPVLAGVPPVYVGFEPVTDAGWPIWPGAQFCHRPLYFEEPCVERCGCTSCCQPVCSAAHFFGTVAILPLKFYQQCPGSCVCTPPAF